ncbi:hypothetical protein PpBr36_01856 [Pyricularia pennisetigena]|uniref:hypothetical protein n=1 Tax=Pyricularia pennisetigena TaxID=1578925 RepID=UPI00114FDDF6|nr:hypothetical protein PpBr36_01856 [Pyricularia pennisetigena]TLS29838.1 hypothetical protein PpBr36_01856 [Pyricularia pennisetigena]
MINNKYAMRNLLSTKRSTGMVVLSTWAVFAFLFYIFFYPHSQEGLISSITRKLDKAGTAHAGRQKELQQNKEKGEEALRLAASNSTLGLHSIQFLNLPHRHDRFDAAAIQSLLSGVDLTNFPAVTYDDLKDQGLPPTSRPGQLKKGEIGCWRAHANVWQYQVQKRIPALLILESDAAWDVNLRQQMGVLNKPFRELLVQDNPDVLRQPATTPDQTSSGAQQTINETRTHAKDLAAGAADNGLAAKRAALDNHYVDELPVDPEDPWAARTGLWDILTIGHCFDTRDTSSTSFRVYDDPWGPNNGFMFNEIGMNGPLERQRVVFRAAGMVCTTGYIISLRGAAKLLVRTNFNLDQPVDLIMNDMARAGELVVYSVQQRIVVQWTYRNGLGMNERGAQSDIHNQKADGKWDMSGWDTAWKTKDVYDYKWSYENSGFENFALQKAWDLTWNDWDNLRRST